MKRMIGWIGCGALVFLAASVSAQRGPKHLCLTIEGTPGALEYTNICKHCVHVEVDLINSDGDPETAEFTIPAKSTQRFETANYPRVRVPMVDVCAEGEDPS